MPLFASAKARSIAFGVFVALYSLCLLAISAHLSLWLDEVIQLIGTRDMGFAALLRYIARDPGQVPLGYIVQSALLHTLGFSKIVARLPSIVLTVVAVLALARLSRISAVLFALTPMVIRYATEARPYAIALGLAMAVILLFNRLRVDSKAAVILLYVICATAAIYAQPYSVFIPLGCAAWSMARTGLLTKLSLVATGAVVIAVLLYLPWFLYSTTIWNHGGSGMPGTFDLKTGAMVLRELVGAGYAQSAVVIAGCALWLREPRRNNMDRLFWIILALLPLLAPLAADIHYKYFLASRQWLFALPALCYMAAEGIATLRGGYCWIAVGLVLLIFLVADVRWFTKPREDWAHAAHVLASRTNACIAFSPPGDERFYAFFEPSVATRKCTPSSNLLVVGVSKYLNNVADIERTLPGTWVKEGVLSDGEPKVFLYGRGRSK